MRETGVVGKGEGELLGEVDLGRVVGLLRAGEPVGLPTETVYGLAANAWDAEACARIFAAKERPFYDPLICHLPSSDFLQEVVEVEGESRDLVERLVQAFWPGPLTLVLPKKERVPDLVTAGLMAVAVRCSAHPVFRQVVEACGFPLAAPSANRFGRVSPTEVGHVMAELGGRIAMVVDGGKCGHGLESTIVRVIGERLEILRPGPILREELEPFAEVGDAKDLRGAPGNLPSHYAPRTPLYLLGEGEGVLVKGGERAGLMAWEGKAAGDWEAVEKLSEAKDLREAGRRFYSVLRRLDSLGLDAMYAESVPEIGLGATIMQRLRKAAYRE